VNVAATPSRRNLHKEYHNRKLQGSFQGEAKLRASVGSSTGAAPSPGTPGTHGTIRTTLKGNPGLGRPMMGPPTENSLEKALQQGWHKVDHQQTLPHAPRLGEQQPGLDGSAGLLQRLVDPTAALQPSGATDAAAWAAWADSTSSVVPAPTPRFRQLEGAHHDWTLKPQTQAL